MTQRRRLNKMQNAKTRLVGAMFALHEANKELVAATAKSTKSAAAMHRAVEALKDYKSFEETKTTVARNR